MSVALDKESRDLRAKNTALKKSNQSLTRTKADLERANSDLGALYKKAAEKKRQTQLSFGRSRMRTLQIIGEMSEILGSIESAIWTLEDIVVSEQASVPTKVDALDAKRALNEVWMKVQTSSVTVLREAQKELNFPAAFLPFSKAEKQTNERRAMRREHMKLEQQVFRSREDPERLESLLSQLAAKYKHAREKAQAQTKAAKKR